MLKLEQTIKSDLKTAMINKEAQITNTLRMLIAAIRNKEISLREGEGVDLTDEQIIEVIKSEIKKRKDSLEAYQQAQREDLALIEENEITVLDKYMPVQMSDDEIERSVKEVIASLGEVKMSDFGKVMGLVMVRVKGQADGNKVNEIVKKLIG